MSIIACPEDLNLVNLKKSVKLKITIYVQDFLGI